MERKCKLSVWKSILLTCFWALLLQPFLSGNTFLAGVSASKLQSKANDSLLTLEVATNNNSEIHRGIQSAENEVVLNVEEGRDCDKIRYLGCIGSKKIYYDPALRLNWFEALEYCRSLGLELLSIDTTYEHKYIQRNLRTLFNAVNNDPDGDFWTSGSDLGKEGEFSWMTTGRPFGFNRFSTGQPDNSGEIEHCVEIWPRESGPNFLNDRECTFETYPICQYDGKVVNQVV